MSKFLFSALSAAFCLFPAAPSIAAAAFELGAGDLAPAVTFGAEGRLTPDEFARRNHLDAGDVRRRHAASGVVRCGSVRGAGQITLSDDVITTAAHVFYDQNGKLRASGSTCVFIAEVAGEESTTLIEVGTIIAGTTTPYRDAAVHDWAVAKLARPLHGALPYGLAREAHSDAPIRFAARGHSDWGAGAGISLEACRLRQALDLGAEGTREFAFDCAAGLGASGAALLTPGGSNLVAVFVGFRSANPDRGFAFSPDHYNFAVTVEGAFRRAVERVAGAEAAGL